MKRLVEAQKLFDEATEKEHTAIQMLLSASKEEKEIFSHVLKEAENARIEAENNLSQIRKEVLESMKPKRNERVVVKKWEDAYGKEHMIEYVII